MTNRFGSEAKEEGDAFCDLFRPNNQNRASGNTEGIWVIQFETNVEGGGNNTSHFFWNQGSFWVGCSKSTFYPRPFLRTNSLISSNNLRNVRIDE